MPPGPRSTLTVTAAALVSIGVTPAAPSVAKGLTKQFTATGVYTDASTQDLTLSATWSSSDLTTATISNAAGSNGLASSAGVGTTTITATSGAISGSTTLTVTAAALVSIAVTPATPSIAKGLTQQFTATGTYTDASTQDLTLSTTWSSSDLTTATISNAAGSNGLASSAGVGTTTITAATGAISGSTTLTVTAATLVSIAVTPASPSVALSATKQFTATGTYTDASTQDITNAATWASSDPTKATISNAAGSNGLATATASAGTTTISATLGAVSANTVLTVGNACYAGAKNVLVFGPTDTATPAASQFPAGTTSTVVTAAAWAAMTAAQFAAYDLLWVGGDCSGNAAAYSTIWGNQATWGPAVTGRILLSSVDPFVHNTAGSKLMVSNSVTYLGGLGHSSASGATGMWLSMGCSGVDFAPAAPTFGSPLQTTNAGSNATSYTAAGSASPIFAGICISGCATDLQWGSTSHGYFNSFPAAFANLANNTNGPFAVAREQSCF